MDPEAKGESKALSPENFGAGNESRTRDLNLGKVALYQLSYSRSTGAHYRPLTDLVNDSFMNLTACLLELNIAQVPPPISLANRPAYGL